VRAAGQAKAQGAEKSARTRADINHDMNRENQGQRQRGSVSV